MRRIALSAAIFGPVYFYLSSSWSDCLDGSCRGFDQTQFMITALISFVLLLLFTGVGSAITGSKAVRAASDTQDAWKGALGATDFWFGVKLLVAAGAGIMAIVSLI